MQVQLPEKISSKDYAVIKRNLLEELDNSLGDPKRMSRFMKFMRSTWDYSFLNKCLIHAQCPEVVQVMGEKAWLTTHQRTLKEGATPISILAPKLVPKNKDANDKNKKKKDPKKEEKIFVGCTIKNVYDISQTEGPDVELITEMGIDVANPADLLEELVFIFSLDEYILDLQAMGFKENSRVDGKRIHINQSLTMESKIVELLNILSHIHLQHYAKRKELSVEVQAAEMKMVTTIISNVLGKPVNASVDLSILDNKSITAIFKAADAVSKAIGVSLKKNG